MNNTTTKEVQHFARDVLGFELFPYQINYVRALLSSDKKIITRRRSMGINSATKVALAIIKANNGKR